MRYCNLDLHIGLERDGVFVVRADCRGRARMRGRGEARGALDFGSRDSSLEDYIRRLETRETDSRFLRELGEVLYRALFQESIQALLGESLAAAAEHGMGVRLRLRIDPPAIAALPWELVYSPIRKAYLATRVDSPIVRYQEMQQIIPDMNTSLPIRILAVIPHYGPRYQPIDARSERRHLDTALSKMGNDIAIEFVEGADANWLTLHDRLRDFQPHCLHFIGHGYFKNEQGHVVLSGVDEDNEVIDEQRFADLFCNLEATKLVILNACNGATASSSQALVGTAASLVSAGVPAVVAMQFDVLDKAAIDFARTFYRSLFSSADSGRVDIAMAHARHLLKARYPDQREFATPVLVTHASDGILFAPSVGVWRDMRRTDSLSIAQSQQTAALDQLHDLHNKAPDDERVSSKIVAGQNELAVLKRRIAIARFATLTAVGIAALAFSLLWIRALDLFALDTRAEFAIMALGDMLVEPRVSDMIVPVGLDLQGMPLGDKRSAVEMAIRRLALARARVVVLDFSYATTTDGGFESAPDAGMAIVRAMESVAPTTRVVVAATAVNDNRLAVPEAMRAAAAGVGHSCVEQKLNLVRSLPLTIGKPGRYLPSLALASVAAYRDGKADPHSPSTMFLSQSPDIQTVVFGVSETGIARHDHDACNVISVGDSVAHRFIRLRRFVAGPGLIDDGALSAITATDVAHWESQTQRYEGRIVVLGEHPGEDIVRDLTGSRPGLLWQTDAINNLLLDEYLRPAGMAVQFTLMILLAGISAVCTLLWLHRRGFVIFGLVLTSALVVVSAIYLYSMFGLLLNPLYHVVALWLAWWVASKLGFKWLR